jgi:hypothetical protein
MAKIKVDPAFAMLLPAAEIHDRNVIRFIFTCKALSDGTQKTISVRIRIAANGEVNVCDYEVTGGPIPSMDQGNSTLFPDNSSMDEDAVETYYLANFGSRTQ